MVGGEPNFGCGRGNLLVRVSWETPRTTSVEVEAREPSGKGFLGNSPDLYFVHCHTVKKEWKVKIDVDLQKDPKIRIIVSVRRDGNNLIPVYSTD